MIEKIKHFITILSIDAISVLGLSLVMFSSVYIKQFDLYIPQRGFLLMSIIVLIVYDVLGSIIYKGNTEHYVADAVIPMGLVFTVILAQYWLPVVITLYIALVISLVFGTVKHKLNISKYIIMLLMSGTIFSSVIATTFFDKVLVAKETTNDINTISYLSNKEWQEKTISERLEYLQIIADYECDKLGCKKTKLSAKAMQERRYAYEGGYYNKSKNEVVISIHDLKIESCSQCVDTVIHELRHRYQNEVVDYINDNKINIDNTKLEVFDTIRAWNESINNYTLYSEGDREYFEQAIEEDAKKYAKIETERVLNNETK